MELTLDGLIRSLRLAAHGLAEDAEAGYVRSKIEPGAHHEGYWNAAGSRRTTKPPAIADGQPARNEGLRNDKRRR